MLPKRRRINTILMILISIFAGYFLKNSLFSHINSLEKNDYEDLEDDVIYDIIDSADELEIKKQYEFPYKYILDEPTYCNGDVQVMNIIPVPASDKASRDGVRRTWGLNVVIEETKLKPLFLVGASKSPEEQQNLEKESNVYHDIVQIDIVDSYLNLTLKTLAAMHWKQSRCQQVPWLLKSDADVFLNPWTVSKTLIAAKKDFVCKVLKQRPVCRAVSKRCRDTRWVMSREMYPHDVYPHYCNGPAYALGQRAVQEVLNASRYRKEHFAMEDVYVTGILPQGRGLQFYNLGSLMCLYNLESPPFEKLAKGKALFVVDSFGKSGGKYTHDDLWKFLYELRKNKV